MIDRLSYATVLVDDREAALAFYRETMGFEKRDDHETPGGGRWLSVSPPDSPFPRLALVAADSETERRRVGSQVADRVAFVFDVEDCRATCRELREAGVEVRHPPRTVPWGVEATVVDPWGNAYDLVEYDPE